MTTPLFPRKYVNDTEYSMVQLRHDWYVAHYTSDSTVELTLVDKTAGEAEEIAKKFCIPVDLPWWKFWGGKVFVQIQKTYEINQ